MEILLGTIATTAGALVLFGLTEAFRAMGRKRRAVRELKQAAFVCLDRLERIRSARSVGDEAQQVSEIYLLGSALDHWRDCIAVSPKDPRDHWSAYQHTVPILLGHELDELGEAISRIGKLVGLDALSVDEVVDDRLGESDQSR